MNESSVLAEFLAVLVIIWFGILFVWIIVAVIKNIIRHKKGEPVKMDVELIGSGIASAIFALSLITNKMLLLGFLAFIADPIIAIVGHFAVKPKNKSNIKRSGFVDPKL